MKIHIGLIFACLYVVNTKRYRNADDIYKNTYSSLFELGLGLTKLSQSTGSTVTVPLAVRFSLCRLLQEASGETREQLGAALDFGKKSCFAEVPTISANLQSFTVILLTKIYVNVTQDISPEFLRNTALKFGVHVQGMEYSSPYTVTAYINKWFALSSYRRLSDILAHNELNSSISIVLASAAHIQTTWRYPFDVLTTRTGKFLNLNGQQVDVPLMSQKNQYFMYYYDKVNRFQMLRLPMLTGRVSMTIVLPDSASLFSIVISKIFQNPNILLRARHSVKSEYVEVTLPKFKVKSTFSWDETLKLAGVDEILKSNSSGLDGILRSHKHVSNMYVNLVKQKVFIDVDESGALKLGPFKGTTDMGPMMEWQRGRYKEFKAITPFLFSIDVEVSNDGEQSILALGVYDGPVQDQ